MLLEAGAASTRAVTASAAPRRALEGFFILNGRRVRPLGEVDCTEGEEDAEAADEKRNLKEE